MTYFFSFLFSYKFIHSIHRTSPPFFHGSGRLPGTYPNHHQIRSPIPHRIRYPGPVPQHPRGGQVLVSNPVPVVQVGWQFLKELSGLLCLYFLFSLTFLGNETLALLDRNCDVIHRSRSTFKLYIVITPNPSGTSSRYDSRNTSSFPQRSSRVPCPSSPVCTQQLTPS